MSEELIIPVDHEALPPLTDDILSWAKYLGQSPSQVVYNVLYGGGTYQMDLSIDKSGNKRRMQLVPGHRWNVITGTGALGPVKSDVMLIGKCLDSDCLCNRRLYTGSLGQILFDACKRVGFTVSQINDFYVATAMLTEYLDYSKSTAPKLWFEQQLPLIYQQLLLVRPRVCILQGSDVAKLFLGKSVNLTNTEGEVFEKTYKLPNGEDHTVKFVTSSSPAAIRHDCGQDASGLTFAQRKLYRQLKHARMVVQDKPTGGDMEIDYAEIDNDVDLEKELKRMRDEHTNKLVAWDAEWQGNHPQNKGAYLRCIQFAYRDDRAAVIAIKHPGGKQRFHIKGKNGEKIYEGANERCAELCKRYMKGLRVVGHYFVADMETLGYWGLDLWDEFDAAKSWQDVETEGGVATELLAHALDETGLFALDEQLQVYTNIPTYSKVLEKYKKQAKEEHRHQYDKLSQLHKKVGKQLKKCRKDLMKLAASGATTKRQISRRDELRDKFTKLSRAYAISARWQRDVDEWNDRRLDEMADGYGWMPDEVLYPYAAYDAVAELVLARELLARVRADRFGNDVRRPYWISHRATKAVLEINTEGMYLDRPTLDKIADRFERKSDELLQQIRKALNWENFNPDSRFEFAEALFGEEYNGYRPQYGKQKRYRPPRAKTIRAEPLRSTGKYPEEWTEIVDSKRQLRVAPSTSKQTLGEMYFTGKELKVRRRSGNYYKPWVYKTENHERLLGLFKDYRTVSQLLKSLIRRPERDALGNIIKDQDEDGAEYSAGITTIVCGDNRVRTRVRQTLETARWAMSPNLQNFSKSKIAYYQKILGLSYSEVNPRTVLRALNADDPGSGGEDWFFVEADYTGAELFTVAVLAQDEVMIDHCTRNNLPDDDPNFYDIHSALTVAAFQLNCAPTKDGLESLGKSHLRVVGKSIVFGTLYGRGARAIAIALRQEGIFVTVEEAKALQETFFKTYPKMAEFLQKCGHRVSSPGWLCNAFGRYRRFPFTDNLNRLKAYEREASNAPIQGTVADAMSLAVRNIVDLRDKAGMRSKLCLQIHDSVQMHVPASELNMVIDPEKGLLKRAMVDMVPLRVRNLSGKLLSDKVFRYGSEIDIYDHWGRDAAADRLVRAGYSPELSGWKKIENYGDDVTRRVWKHKQYSQLYDENTDSYFTGA